MTFIHMSKVAIHSNLCIYLVSFTSLQTTSPLRCVNALDYTSMAFTHTI